MRTRFLSLILAPILALVLTVSASAQTALTETTLAAAATASQNFVVLTSATGVTAGGGIYIDREFMTVSDSYVSGTRVPVLRRGASVAHAASVPVFLGPAAAFVTRDYDGACVAANETYLPRINTNNGNIWDCGSNVEKWINLRDLVVVTCRALLVADMVDQSCFTANRPYLLYKIAYVHATPESAGTLTVIPRRQQSTEAPASGDALATAINAVAAGTAAQTVVTATLTTSEANLMIMTGDRLGLDFTDDTAGELAGVTVTFWLYPL